jgi:hypothetical protein
LGRGFVWDQLRWREPVAAVGDAQIALAAIAGATERIRLGPMITPLARHRPAKVARETATLDRLSGGPPHPRSGRGAQITSPACCCPAGRAARVSLKTAR